MRVLVLGADGYLGWATCMALAAAGHEVTGADNGLRRRLCAETGSPPLFPLPALPERADLFRSLTGHRIDVREGDLSDPAFTDALVQDAGPHAVVHYAEQPSAPYSMMGPAQARLTLDNNLRATHNIVLAVLEHAPDCHMVKLGTMGEYGTPNIDIEEGWLTVEHNGRSETFLYPRQAGSLYHTTKVLDTDLLWFYVRLRGLAVTDLMQGPVYGILTPEAEMDDRLLPVFNYDDIFGTVLNRFLVQAVAGEPLTVYGKGGQTRGYLDIRDTIACVELALEHPAKPGQLRILNQFTETFTVNDLAGIVHDAGADLDLSVAVEHVDNPRKEAEEHYYNPAHSGLTDLGLKPHLLTRESAAAMLHTIRRHAARIDRGLVRPRVRWS